MYASPEPAGHVVQFARKEAEYIRMLEPVRKRKTVRVLTVAAYIFFVSLAAIMLSAYYVLLWQQPRPTSPEINDIIVDNTHCNCSCPANSTPIPKISSVGTTITRALNLVPTTPMLETTTSYIDEDTNYTTPFSQELTSS